LKQQSKRRKLNNCTFVLGDKPTKTMSASIMWTDKTHDKQKRHGNGGKIGGVNAG